MNKQPWQTLPRFPLGHWPTPLEPLPRLSAELGGPNIWVKRDDCSGLAAGGNKTRKLEFLVGQALQDGADTIVTFGAVQSNHARQTAAACAKAGVSCHLVLTRQVANDDPAYETGGNVLLGKLVGARQHLVDADDVRDFTRNLLAALEAEGRQTYLVPAGGSNALGAMGYAMCAQEITEQAARADVELTHILHASSSAGTRAGLLFGLRALRQEPKVTGINVYHPDPATLHNRVQSLLQEMAEAYLAESDIDFGVHVNHAYIGAGYGQPTDECLAAIGLAARLEGLLFDPVYSGKALAAVIDQINLGNLDDAKDVILIHTGGTPALNVYASAFA